ncbi:MAG: hypothetical protein Q7R35_05895 [Elusimicrobiota bacterium]|nr:hypothetical protein [Elusimicrobiota bacterium]
MISRLLSAFLFLPAIAGAATIEGRDLVGGSLICGPGSTANNSIPCSPNDVLSGVFTNVGLFQINAGTTVFVTPGISLVIFASTISIPGTLNGSGRGEVGGIGGDPGLPGGDGEGRGPGMGAAINMGGGGGGYGGDGGNGSGSIPPGLPGDGGAAYDDTAFPVSPGSLSQGSGGGGGGGSGSQTGGSGGQSGASIYLEASSFTLTGSIFVRGVPGGNSTKPADAGGGGSGGSLLLRCMDSATVGGVINAAGGKGGDAAASGSDTPYPGGGGGGGRVKIYYRQAAFSVAISTNGGSKGAKSANGPEGGPSSQPGSVGVVSFARVASSPASLTVPNVFSTSITWSWTAAPDWGDAAEASRQYRLYSGTVSYRTPDRSPQLVVTGGAVSATETGLIPNTAYTRYATAFTDHSDSLPSDPVSTHTLAGLPGAAASAFTAVAAYSLNLNWSAGEPANPAYTSYGVDRSTDINFGGNVYTSYVTSLSSAPAGLIPNTTYHFRVRAINLDNLPTGFTPVVSTATLAAAPASPSFSGVNSTGFIFSWNGADNPPLTRYIAEISTDNFATLARSSSTFNTGAAFTDLAVNTLYYARARAQNHNGLDTAFTAAVTTITNTSSPLNAPAPFTNLSDNALTFNWGSDGNSAGTSYNPEISINSDFSAPVSSAVTINLNYVFTGLSVNATYYARVRALGAGGLASPYSNPVVSTVTLTLSPVTAVPPFTLVFASSFTFAWENGGNPGGTFYTAEISRDGFVSVSSAVRTSALSAPFSALEGNTVYQARVRAVNFTGIPGPYSSPIVSTATAISAPGNAAIPFTNLSAGGLTFSWEAGGNTTGTSYNPEISTSSNFSAPVSSQVTANLNYVFTGLSVNTTYYAHVRAIGVGGAPTSYTGSISTVTYTLSPAVPASPFAGLSTAGLTFGWENGGNPDGTLYISELSRNSFATLIASAAALSPSTAFSGLTPNTIYQARVKARSFLGVDGPYSNPIRSTTTLAAVPFNADQPFTAVSASTFTFTWGDGGNPGGTSYAVETSSSNFAPGTAISSAATLALSQTFSGLLPNTTYYGRVKAINMDNVPSGYPAVVAAVTLPLSPALAAAPFSGVTSSGFTLDWTDNGNPQNTAYTAEISQDGFVSISSAVQTSALSAAFAALAANTIYQARVWAVNFAGIPGQYSSAIVSTATASSAPGNAAVSFPNLSAAGLTFSWAGGGNASGTNYNPEISTSSNFSAPVSSEVTTNLNYIFTGLAVNTTYYAHVRALGVGGLASVYSSPVASTVTYTLAPAVPALPFAGISTAGITFSWVEGGNPPGTRYTAEISRDSFATLIASASTLSTSAAFSGLAQNTIYQARVKALNFLGVDGPYSSPIRSTTTLATIPLNTGQSFTAVSAATFTFNWADGGNPGGTAYTVEISSSNFAPATAISSAATLALNQTFSGLLPNTTYYARVKAVNMDNVPSGYPAVVAAVTLPLSPALAAAPFSGVTSSGFTLDWTANGNPQNTAYTAEISRDGFVSVSSAIQTSALSATFSALAPNTVYQARVWAVNFAGIPGQYSSAIVSTVTASSAPGNAAVPFANLSAGGLTFAWGDSGNASGTNYNPELSTGSGFSAPVSSGVTTNLNYIFTGLAVNTTYYARVRALGVGGLASPYSSPVVSSVTYTLEPAIPASPFTSISTTGFTFSWTEGGNPPGTRYAAEISRDGFVSISSAIRTSALGTAFSGLAANTVYQARVWAVNFAGITGQYSSPIVSTATSISAPGNAAVSFPDLSAGGLTFAWGDGGNPPGTNYNPAISTNSSFSAPVSSDVTTNLNYVFTGLSVNTTYYAHVRALGVGGNPTSYAGAVSTVTYTLAPVVPASPFTNVNTTGLTFNWSEGGNPPDTRYAAEISRDGFVSVSSAIRTSALSAAFSGLSANMVYQARVRAVNFAGIPGQYSSPIVSTATSISAPGNAAVPFPALSAGGLTFTWGDSSNAPGTSYNPEISTSSSFSAPVSSEVTTNLNYIFTGLSVNTTYYVHVRAIGVGGNPTSYTGAVSTVTYTLAPVVPASPFTGLSTAGLTFSWESGGNPGGTLYISEISKDSFVTIVASASTLSTNAAFAVLTPNTICQARVKARNFLGVDGPYSGPIRSTATLATVPFNADQPFTAVSAAAFTFTWGDGGNPGGTFYSVEVSSAGFSPGTAISSAATLALSQTFGGLLPNTTYYGRVKAVNRDNVPSGYTAAVAAVTLPLPPALAASPFSGVTSSALALGWTANGNPQNTAYVAEISRDNFVSIFRSSATPGSQAAFTGLTPNTIYTARVKAVNFSGSAGPYADTVVSTFTLAVPPQPAVPPFILTDSGLTVQWSAGGNPAGTQYEAEVSTRPDFSLLWAGAAVTGVSEGFALAPNTTYYARVRARNYGGVPTAELELGGALTYAALPAVSASTTTGSVNVTTFSFTNTVSTGTGGLQFYRSAWDRNATHVWNDQESSWAALGVVTTTATGNGYWYLHLRSYNFNALGYKTADIGPFHVALSTVLPPGQPVPVPGAFTATSGITWSWPPAIAFGDTLISTYVVSVGTTPADFNVLVDSEIGPLASFTLDPAANGKTYYLKVRAIDEGGILSQYSPVSSLGVLVDRTAPERLATVQADRKFSYDSNILFSWSPAADTESGIKSYFLDVGTARYGNDILNAEDVGLELSYQATGLPGGKSVFARVRAENNAGGFSDYSELGPGIPVWTLEQTPPMVKPYNWPNPFDPERGPTQIGFFLKAPAKVILKLFTLEGNLVYEEARAEGSGGNKVWPWAGRNGTGKTAAPGGYICIIEKRYTGKTERQQFKLAVLY